MDPSNIVAWSVALLGVPASALWAQIDRRAGRRNGIGSALGIACMVGFAFTFVAATSLDACIASKLCVYKGEKNMEYWFHSLLAIPVYWVTALAPWKSDK